MFDIGGWEFLVIVVLAIVVIGPKDLPGAIRNVTGWIRRARELARDFQSGLDDIARETELDKVQQDIRESIDGDGIGNAANSIRKDIEDAIDPDDEIRNAFVDDGAYDDPDDVAAELDADEDEIRRVKADQARRMADDAAPEGEKTAAAEAGPDDKPDDAAPPARAGTGA
jgi:sec-independent protein translocase protein TatB